MFRKDKDLIERTKTFLKNKEVRNLRQILLNHPNFSLTSVQCHEILPEKGNVIHTKLMNKTLVYSVLDIPYFFDLYGRNDFYPTIFTLFQYPSILRHTIVIYEPVAEYLLNGADLMLPGVASIPDLHTLGVGEIVGIRIVGNPIPFAVGKSEIDGQMIDALRENNHAGWKKGKCVSIVHIFGDLLWQHCRDHLRGADIPGVNDPMTLAYPNVGFSRQSLSVTSIEQECVTATPESASESSDMKGEDGKGEPSDIKESFEAPVKECCEEEISNIVEGTESLHISSEADIIDLPDATDEPVILTTIPPEIMDNLLIISLLRTLKYLIKDKDLPMLTSAFWSIVTRALLPTDVGLFLPKTQHCEIKLEIKHSSYKKTSAFLKHLQSYGLLTLVNDRIVSVNRQHEYFRDYKDHIRVENSEEFRMHVSVSSSNEHNASHPSKTVSDPSSRLKIIDLFKFPRPIREVLVSVVRNGGSNSLKDLEDHLSWLMGEGPYGECMIHSEVQWLLSSYVAIQNLQDPANRGSLIIPTTDPLYMHLTRIKGIHKEDPSTIRNDSELRENPETNLPELSSPDEDEPPVAPTQGYDQPYEMVGGVLVTPLCRENNQATSRPTLVEHDPETIQHTPAKWKPVTLPPAPPPNVRVAHPTKVHKKEKTPSEPVIQGDLHLTKEDLMYRLRNALIPYHAILLPTGELTVATGPAPKIVIEAEMRSGNKVVTRMSGLESYGLNSQQCAKEFQKKFACSATVGTSPTRPKELEIVVQGNWISELEEYLKSFCNIPTKLIEAKKLQKKKKK